MVQGRLPTAPPARNRSPFVPSRDDFTEMQRRFCEEYLIDLDGPRAAIRSGYPPERAQAAAAAMLRHPPARDYLARLMAVRSARTGINADRVLRTLGEMLLADPGDLFHPDGSLKLPSEMAAADRMLIAGIKTQRRVGKDDDGKPYPEVVTELKLVPRETILQLAMRHLSMLNDKVTVEHTSLADRLREAQARREGRIPGRTIEGEIVEDGEPENEAALLTYEPQAPALDPETEAALKELLG